MRQLGSALVALVIMLACAALSEQFIPAVASQEPSHARGIAADTVVTTMDVAGSRDVPPRLPEQLVMLLAGLVLMGLGGALRTPHHDR